VFRKVVFRSLVALAGWAPLLATAVGGEASTIEATQASATAAAHVVSSWPLAFEPVQEQGARGPTFAARLPGSVVLLDATSIRLRSGPMATPGRREETVAVRFLGANADARPRGERPRKGHSHYFLGSDPQRWRSSVPRYGAVRVPDLYPGIDVLFHGRGGDIEYDFQVRAGADPSAIRLSFESVDQVAKDADGRLSLSSVGGRLHQTAPIAYQVEGRERRFLDVEYVLDGDGEVTLRVAGANPNLSLVIDPVLIFSTYLGGSADDLGSGLGVDDSGNVYIAGCTQSLDFPTVDPLLPMGGFLDAYVAKLDPGGTQLLYSTYLGGAASDCAIDLAVDGDGNAYVVGYTYSTNFPTADPLQSTAGGGGDVFITKLDSSGSVLHYSTYLGGSAFEDGRKVAVDDAGAAYVVGYTDSSNFPTTRGAMQELPAGDREAFVSRIVPDGSALAYSTYLGGTGYELAWGIGLDAEGNAYVVGETTSTDFPVLAGAASTNSGSFDAFVTKLDPTGASLVYSTYLGGQSDDFARSIAIAASGKAFVTGHTYSYDFPTVDPLQPGLGGFCDAFVTQLDASGSSIVRSTYLGGDSFDAGKDIMIGASGNLYVAGGASSTDFPTVDPIQEHQGGYDVFLARLDPLGSRLLFSTYFGGTAEELARKLAFGGGGRSYLLGHTYSSDFPTLDPIQPAFGGGPNDVFVVRIDHEDVFTDGFESGDTTAWSSSVP